MMRAESATWTVDGNVLAGLLAGVFDGDATVLVGICGGCGAAAPLAETAVEIDEAAAIVRCRSCTHTLLTVLQIGDDVRIVFGMLGELRRSASVTPAEG